MIGISHSGVRLIKRNRLKATNDTLQVLETFSFDLIQQISPLRSASTLEVRVGKKRLIIHSHRVNSYSTWRSRFIEFYSFRFKRSNKSWKHFSTNLDLNLLDDLVYRIRLVNKSFGCSSRTARALLPRTRRQLSKRSYPRIYSHTQVTYSNRPVKRA